MTEDERLIEAQRVARARIANKRRLERALRGDPERARQVRQAWEPYLLHHREKATTSANQA